MADLEIKLSRFNTHNIHKLYLDNDSLDLIERGLIARSILELGCLRALIAGDGLGILDGGPVRQVGGDAGGPEGMAASPGRECSGDRSSLDHVEGVVAAEGPTGQFPAPSVG